MNPHNTSGQPAAPAAPAPAPDPSQPAAPAQQTLPLQPSPGGSPAAPAAAPSPLTGMNAVAASAGGSNGPTVPVPAEFLQTIIGMQAKMQEYEARWADQQRQAQESVVAEQLRRGQAEQAVQTLRQQHEIEATSLRNRLNETESRAKAYAKDRALAEALAAHQLHPGAMPHLMTLLSGQLEAHPEGNGFVVRTPTFQTPQQFVAEQLSRPEFSMFRPASTMGGVGAPTQAAPAPSSAAAAPPVTTHAPAQPSGPPTPEPKNLGEAMVLHMRQAVAESAKRGGAAMDLGLPFGTRRSNN